MEVLLLQGGDVTPADDEPKPWPVVIVGLALAFVSSLLSSAGFVMQRKAHLNRAQDLPHRRLLVGGLAVYISSALPDVISYALVTEVVGSTMACFRLVVVAVFAHVFLKEHLRRREVLGMACCTAGTVLCVIFGPSQSRHPLSNGRMWVYGVICLSLLGALLALEFARKRFYCFKKWQRFASAKYMLLPAATAFAYGLQKVFNTQLGLLGKPPVFPVGLVQDPGWTLLAVAIVLLGLTDLYLNMRGAREMRVAFFVPITFALTTAQQYFQSAVLFKEFQHMEASHVFISATGAVISLVGSLCVQPREAQAEDPSATAELEMAL